MATAFIAATVPAKIDRVSGTTLFRIALQEDGDPLQWAAIAQINGLLDPWIFAQADIKIPPVFPTGTQTGLLLVTPGGATVGIPQT